MFTNKRDIQLQAPLNTAGSRNTVATEPSPSNFKVEIVQLDLSSPALIFFIYGRKFSLPRSTTFVGGASGTRSYRAGDSQKRATRLGNPHEFHSNIGRPNRFRKMCFCGVGVFNL